LRCDGVAVNKVDNREDDGDDQARKRDTNPYGLVSHSSQHLVVELARPREDLVDEVGGPQDEAKHVDDRHHALQRRHRRSYSTQVVAHCIECDHQEYETDDKDDNEDDQADAGN